MLKWFLVFSLMYITSAESYAKQNHSARKPSAATPASDLNCFVSDAEGNHQHKMEFQFGTGFLPDESVSRQGELPNGDIAKLVITPSWRLKFDKVDNSSESVDSYSATIRLSHKNDEAPYLTVQTSILGKFIFSMQLAPNISVRCEKAVQ